MACSCTLVCLSLCRPRSIVSVAPFCSAIDSSSSFCCAHHHCSTAQLNWQSVQHTVQQSTVKSLSLGRTPSPPSLSLSPHMDELVSSFALSAHQSVRVLRLCGRLQGITTAAASLNHHHRRSEHTHTFCFCRRRLSLSSPVCALFPSSLLPYFFSSG